MEHSFTILVVDDESSFRNILKSLLQNEGYTVEIASDGDEAIKTIEEKKFDLVLLDIKMPRVGGFEVLKFVKEKFPATKVIMLTGFSEITNSIESKNLGADGFLSKPYDLVDLLSTVEKVLSAA